MDAQLSALKVGDAERRQITKPLVAMIGVDLYSAYSQVMERITFWKAHHANLALNANHTPETFAENQKLSAAIDA